MKKLILAIALTLTVTLIAACFSVSAEVTDYFGDGGLKPYIDNEGAGTTFIPWTNDNCTQSTWQDGYSYCPVLILSEPTLINEVHISTSQWHNGGVYEDYDKVEIWYSSDKAPANQGTDDPTTYMTKIGYTAVSEEAPGCHDITYTLNGAVTAKSIMIKVVTQTVGGWNVNGGTVFFASYNTEGNTGEAGDPSEGGDNNPGGGNGGNNAGTSDFALISVAIAALAGAGVCFASKKRK